MTREGAVLPVLLGSPPLVRPAPRRGLGTAVLLGAAMLVCAGGARAFGPAEAPSDLAVVLKWAPLLLGGFAFNVLISVMAMAIGTLAGVALGLPLVSPRPAARRCAWAVMQFFRNAPWLVLLFFAMFLIPYRVTLFGVTVPLPDWLKATLGFSLPVMANVAEILRGAVASLPVTQREACESLGMSWFQSLRLVILPQCVKRMIPPWMNLYQLVAMATVEASIVGVSEMLTLTAQVHAAEGGRPGLFAPLYAFALLCFFLYCTPIDAATRRLERRFHVV